MKDKIFFTPAEALKHLEEMREGIEKSPSLIPLWDNLKQQIDSALTTYFSELNEGKDTLATQYIQNLVKGVRLVKDHRKFSDEIEKREKANDQMSSINLGNLQAGNVSSTLTEYLGLPRIKELANEVKFSYLPSWLIGTGVGKDTLPKPPHAWFSEDKKVIFGADVWEKAFIHKGKQPLNAEEYNFVVEYILGHCEAEIERGQSFFPLYKDVLPIFFSLSESNIKTLLENRIQDDGFQMSHEETSLIKNLGKFVTETLKAIKNPADPRHAAARKLIDTYSQFSHHDNFIQIWREFLSRGLANRDLANEGIGIVDFLNSLSELAEETKDEWYEQLAQDIIRITPQFPEGPELFLPSLKQAFKTPELSLTDLEAQLILLWKEALELFKNQEPNSTIDIDHFKIVETVGRHLTSACRPEGCEFHFSPDTLNFFASVHFYDPENKGKKTSFIAEVTDEEKLNFSLSILDADSEQESQDFIDVKKTFLQLSIDVLKLAIEYKKSQLERIKQSLNTVFTMERKTLPQQPSRKRKSKTTIGSQSETSTVPPELQEASQLNSHRPEMIIPENILENLPGEMSADFLRKKIELYNKGGLSLMKATVPAADRIDRYVLKFGKYRVISKMGADGKLSITEVVIRTTGTYRR